MHGATTTLPRVIVDRRDGERWHRRRRADGGYEYCHGRARRKPSEFLGWDGRLLPWFREAGRG